MEIMKHREFSKRFNQAVEASGLPATQKALGKLLGVSEVMIWSYKNGEKLPRMSTATRMAEKLGVSVEWLLTGSGVMRPDDFTEGDNISSPVPVTRMLPVISWIRAGALCDSEDPFEPGDAEEWIPAPLPCSNRTFCLKVNGDSMMPEYRDGERIIVDPEVAAVHGEDVVVRTPDGKSTFKRLQITQDGTFLLALNPEYPNRIVEVPEGTHICGVVVASLMTRKK